MENYFRKCPKCGEEIPYSRKGNKVRAEKRNTNCLSCVKKGENNPAKRPEVRKKMSESKLGKNNPAKRPEVRKKISESLMGRKLSDEHKKNIKENHSDISGKNNPMYGKTPWNKGKTGIYFRSEETKKNMRISANKRIEKLYGQISPNYNPVGCEMINWFNMYYGFNFQHAENGGEVCIDGYWPDGVDEERKTIIEVDEKHHFDVNGKLKQKDIQRQNYLESLGYKFIRVRV